MRARNEQARCVDRLRKEEQARDLTFEYCLITAGTSRNRAPSNQRLEQGDIIRSIPAAIDGYIGDLCRMGILGQPDAQLKELLQEIEEIQQVAPRSSGRGRLAARSSRPAKRR